MTEIEEAKKILFEMNRLDSLDLDAESLTLNEVWKMVKDFLTKFVKNNEK